MACGIILPADYSPGGHAYLHLYENSKTGEKSIGIYSKATPAIRDMNESYTCLLEAKGKTPIEANRILLSKWNDLQKTLNSKLLVKWQVPDVF